MGLPDLVIPEEKLPKCWSDDVRMNALFAPFRLRTANPESWEMKMKFWSDMLRLWCRCKKDPIVSAGDAKFAFQRKARTPACVDIVIEEMFRSGELSPISKYHQILHNGPEGWVRWGARLAFRPAAFALTAVTSLLPARQALDNDGLPKASIDSTQRFVLESAVQEQATELLNNYPPGMERIGTIEELMGNCNWDQSREVFEVLLGYLVAQGCAVKKDDIVKLAEPNKKASPVTDNDEALVKLLSAQTRLENDAARLSKDAAAAERDARSAMQLGNRLAAKNHLRRKHKSLQRVTRCEAALDNVHQLLQQMRDVDVNTAIVDTYRTSSKAMKQGMQDGGLDEDSVHDTLDDLKEVMETYSEIEKALGNTIEDLDQDELEEELKELLAAPAGPGGGTPGKEERRQAPKLPSPISKLPSPPSNEPKLTRKETEPDFVFDGEERVIAELNELGIEDASPRQKKVPVAEWISAERPRRPKSPKATKAWYPPSGQCLQPETWNNNLDTSLQNLADGFGELKQDERLHPGQPLKVDYTSPPRLYNTDFQVQDHKMSGGVWLYNTRDGNSNMDSGADLTASTEYFSSESPGKTGGTFQMAPGGERKKSHAWPNDEAPAAPPAPEEAPLDDLERRLRKLRGFNL